MKIKIKMKYEVERLKTRPKQFVGRIYVILRCNCKSILLRLPSSSSRWIVILGANSRSNEHICTASATTQSNPMGALPILRELLLVGW